MGFSFKVPLPEHLDAVLLLHQINPDKDVTVHQLGRRARTNFTLYSFWGDAFVAEYQIALKGKTSCCPSVRYWWANDWL